MDFLKDYMVFAIVGICLCVGYIIKKIIAKDMFDHEFLFITDYDAKERAFYHMRDENG